MDATELSKIIKGQQKDINTLKNIIQKLQKKSDLLERKLRSANIKIQKNTGKIDGIIRHRT